MRLGDIRSRLRPRTRARQLLDRRREAWLETRYARWRDQPLEPDTVLYESFFGNGMLDHPEAIFRYLHQHPDFAHLRHVWVLDDLQGHPGVTARARARRAGALRADRLR